ncbi:FtsW/RodA/SpoVE family cell cycle protein [Phocicoccus pinnipedialis]|uniref:Probable peptidoglycan glycosyltransferase FtsW n=1 Tax=Phocicoccus pinnipedialis TaxID=110845 RepID=A0A6V7RHU9_9BACL|nr:FtsW/RodA/SpoVE family cell cycle protein [Jeotgalicoccus pinnipedialis]MBP1939013.1 cell division protein FtsW [Jeotgalicoccus pinnipedialis]CAD2077181.1 Lipid II flippase FtsW [Jeotgalicoccus pinnipedialis]
MRTKKVKRKNTMQLNKYIDYTIPLIYIVLTVIGLITILSATMVSAGQNPNLDYNPAFFFNSQLRYAVIGSTVFVFMLFFTKSSFYKQTWLQVLMVAGIFVLLVMIAVMGDEVNGEKNWVRIGFINIQGSEFLKIVAILYLAYIYDLRNKVHNGLEATDWKHLAPFALMLAFATWILNNDFGTGLIILSIIFGMFFYLNFPRKYTFIIVGTMATVLAIFILAVIVFDGSFIPAYQLNRIQTFLHPFQDTLGSGYQLSNSLIAISHGGLFGTGLGNGIMKLGYIPEPQTDFIFAVFAEEFGLVGVIVVLMLYAFLVYKCFYYSTISTDLFLKLITFGIGIYITIQCFLNVGGMSRALPLTGVPLPLMSFGGSSFLSISIALALLSVAAKEIRYRKSLEE